MTVKIWLHNNCPSDTIHAYLDAINFYEAMKTNLTATLNTTCVALCHNRVLCDENRLVLVYQNQEVELIDGKVCISGRLISKFLNLQHLLEAGEFDPAHNSSRLCHILQMEANQKNHGRIFAGLAERKKWGYSYPNISEYVNVYDFEMRDDDDFKSVFERFNLNHPNDFEGHSLSISDVLIIDCNGFCCAYMVDCDGYERLDHRFFSKQKEER